MVNMQQTGLLVLLISALVLAGACTGDKPGNDSTSGQDVTGATSPEHKQVAPREPQLTNTFWKLCSIYGKRPAPPLQGIAQIYLEFEQDLEIFGYGGCNSVIGTYSAAETIMSFSPSLRTDVDCPRKDEEIEFMKMLHEVAHYRLTTDSLVLFNAESNRIAAFLSVTHLLFDR